jgi:hypothetical protein
MTTSALTYRDRASLVVDEVIKRVGRESRPRLMRELKKAYPFEESKGWPYKVWLQEVKFKTGGFKPRKDKNQLDLFEGMGPL